ncbi:hypothetical protein OCU04_011724 [Sclerotinia nivalis]|uniref:Uncharacterized protein n=1 Tax=Sclerotinia nivalis TaxID=352851 RepID=A0A9X0AAQ9_9HELO|nr:hypothetical protein OCU04_011724 [Sclerotinia nivalis]
MSSRLHLSSQPSSPEEFATAVASDTAIWYRYLISLYEFSIRMETEVTDLQSAIQKLTLDLQVEKTKEENDRLITHLIQFHPVPVAPPVSIPTDLTDSSLLTPVTTPIVASVLSKSQLSKKVSDPASFDGTKIDFDRFVDQIQNKILTRFAAMQIRLYNIKGQFIKLADYKDLLQILERVYRNQNKRAEA